MNPLFPVFLKLDHLDVLLVGGGNVGLEKLSAILANSPRCAVTVVATYIREELRTLAQLHPQVQLLERPYQEADLENKDLVILATDNPSLHVSIKEVTRQRRILTNVADTPNLCDFYLGSIVQKGDLKIAISTNGKSPTLAKRLRELLTEVIPNDIQLLLDNLVVIRDRMKGDFQSKITQLNKLTESLVNKEDPSDS
ncbi:MULTISPECIES: bifunctional precorrin-2 dehydrogenase/sirohydrochlorin ferrochelatase [unclassified Siphonobacter]|uniref:precorrin-2 dehydrogenase/sirohydrochlorin ferrochelatase family protein n=1 Tax=unclassified Siphonobacter TaxID=2635712 RepID=UPI000CB0544A|nr:MULTISPECIES: bifunctional precorrin-2 dehydrogenase/sirohydrochlorin ferrochelatase [unclassified Siphonobacter]MDQ1087871.1 precorrin-2 dehydrogenase/sirohydrochlorin ferrochelatase [Siphonobacter sp. SORGH_AS_1065]MDR6194016.1 precorrin-2 dehydrogenase/sirohydrochlorin ferrochelatase [Siphonobacter sp. SORGH_AS_0500]PKK34631.1 siroheme synthase [Siphonobacter sp. SORGH_AS_0500]